MAHYKGAASEGNRAATLMKQREKQKEELEFLKKKIADVRVSLHSKLLRMRKAYYTSHTRNMGPRNLKCRTSSPLLSTSWRSSSSPVPLVGWHTDPTLIKPDVAPHHTDVALLYIEQLGVVALFLCRAADSGRDEGEAGDSGEGARAAGGC